MPSIIIDPGHGDAAGRNGRGGPNGAATGQADGNGHVSAAEITAGLARRIAISLREGAGAAKARAVDKCIDVHLAGPGRDRHGRNSTAGLASALDASVFVHLFFNDFDGETRGTEAWIDRKNRECFRLVHVGSVSTVTEGPGKPGSGTLNPNHVDDAAFASDLARAVHAIIAEHDWGAKLRCTHYHAEQHGEDYLPPPGVKMMALDGLREVVRGSAALRCKACLLGVEFIDHPAVKRLFNGGSDESFHDALADAIAGVLVQWA